MSDPTPAAVVTSPEVERDSRAAATNPPRAPLVLRVGVTGHRPDPTKGRSLPDETRLRATIREILQNISDAVHGVVQASGAEFDLSVVDAQPHQSHVRVVSALAEGADQWITDEALELGYDLQCPLPFPREEYEQDFENPKAKAEFQRLLKRASAVLELDGQVNRDPAGVRKPSSAAYEAVGRALLNQTDLLVAVWDGKPSQGRGGTGAVAADALQRGIPMVWVIWSSPDTWVLRLPEWRLVQRSADIQGDTERLKEQVQSLLLPPAEPDTAEQGRPTTKREQYFDETRKHGNALHGWWQVFLSLSTGEIFTWTRFKALLAGAPFRVRDFEEATRADWEKEAERSLLDTHQPHAAAPRLAALIDASYLRHYAWANRLSVYYANLYRSAFVVSYLLAAAAVFLALFATAAGLTFERGLIFTAFELLAILTILALTSYGRHRHWHERWVDYRMLAERLRLARCLALLGGGGQQVSLAPHLATYGNPAATWMHWHYQSIERAAGLPAVRFTTPYLEASQTFWLTNLIEDQIKYHRDTGTRYKKMDDRLHNLGAALFVATLVACGLHLFGRQVSVGSWPIVLAAIFPAFGAALSAIRTQAEAQRLARRSFAMQKSLEQIRLDFASLPAREGEGHSQRLRQGADRVTELMVREMLDWRVVLLDRPLETHI